MEADHTDVMPTASPCSRYLFRFGKTLYTWGDVLGWAEFSGCLDPALNTLFRGAEAFDLAESGEIDFDQDDLQHAANRLRYDLNLITAEETETWLQTRGLSLDDLNAYLFRQVCRQHVQTFNAEWIVNAEIDIDWICAELWSEIVFSQELPAFVSSFIWRLAVHESAGAAVIAPPKLVEAENRFHERHALCRNWPVYRETEYLFIGERLRQFLELDAAYLNYCDANIPKLKCELLLKTYRIPFIRVRFEKIAFESHELAKEALFCVTMDGDSLSAVAAKSSGDYAVETVFMDDIPENLKPRFLSATVGEPVVPQADEDDDVFTIYRVLEKTEPDPNDPDVHARLCQKWIADNLRPFVARQIAWEMWPLDLLHG